VPDRADPSLPLVSIVTPSLNQGRFIAETIESVRVQDYPRIEHIVKDGGSRDETPRIVARYLDRLTWISEADRGQSHAINQAFRMASGEILSWLNTDDRLLPGAVQAVVDAFRADPSVMMLYGDGDLIDASGRRLWPFRFTEPFNLRRLVEVGDFILQPATFVRREALEAVGYLDEDLHWCMDWDLWIRIGQRFRVRYLPLPLAQARIHPDAKTSVGGFAKIREMRQIIRRHSRRRLPPILVIHGGGALYRMGCRALGRDPNRPMSEPGASRPLSTIPWASRLLDRVLETGRLPWEWTPDPELERSAMAAGSGTPGAR
jgi:glycosyltransferase involved in cell wall biosynthesis